jgi:3D (Asp-Asp-Asp) domain-containing protein
MDKIMMLLTIIMGILLVILFVSTTFFPQDSAPKITQIINTPITTIEATVTAYTNRVEETNNDPTHTATMTTPIPGLTCAVSRDLICWLGGRIYIEGVGVWHVDDLMNKRYEQSIDLYMGDVNVAKTFGKQTLKIVYLGR